MKLLTLMAIFGNFITDYTIVTYFIYTKLCYANLSNIN